MTVVLACDLGGSSFRAALAQHDGRFLAESRITGPALDEALNWSEVDPRAWWDLLVASAGQLAREAPEAFAQIEAVAICGVTRTQVFLGHDGLPLRKAITWKDSRAEPLLARLKAALPADHPETGNVNAFHPLARLFWLALEDPIARAKLATVLEPKDYLNFRLTGTRAADPVSFARLGTAARPGPSGGADLLAALGLPAGLVPPLREPWEVVGRVLAGLPAPLDRIAGAQVICSSNDTWIGVVGLGAMQPGLAYNISGTTEVLGVAGREPAAAEGLLTVDWRGLYQLGGPSQTGADAVAWLTALAGATDAGAGSIAVSMEHLLARPRHPQPAIFLPYLQGERVPYWNPALRGAFIGLNRQHGLHDLLWAVMEGVAFLNRRVLERAEAALGQAVAEIRFGGGAATNAAWCRIKADVCGRPVAVGAGSEPGLLGAAILALTALGRFPTLAAAQSAIVSLAVRHRPDPRRQAAYDGLYAVFRDAEEALAPLSGRLVGLTGSLDPPPHPWSGPAKEHAP
jgi:xylulokinase